MELRSIPTEVLSCPSWIYLKRHLIDIIETNIHINVATIHTEKKNIVRDERFTVFDDSTSFITAPVDGVPRVGENPLCKDHLSYKQHR